MHVLVTGGCGFIGSHLVRRLVRQGASVTVLDTFLAGRGTPRNLDGIECAIIQGSVVNWDALRRAMAGAHLVYHLAARTDWSDRPRHPAALGNTNTMGTLWVLTMARVMGVPRVIFTSSSAVYGNVVPGSEEGPCQVRNIYGASKLAAEAYCRGFWALGLEAVILRLFNVYGPGGRSVWNIFKSNGAPVVHGTGLQTRDFVHVSDVVEALVQARLWDDGTYNIGTGVETSILDLWGLLRDGDPVFDVEHAEGLFRNYADTSRVDRLWKARKELEP